ncbi:MAG: HAD-IA family hydrolase [Lacunisphaera sp.]
MTRDKQDGAPARGSADSAAADARRCAGVTIRAITFDVGGTLIEPWPSTGHVYAEMAAQFGVTGMAPDQLTENFRRAWKTRDHFDYSRESWFALVRATFGEVAARLPAAYFPAVFERFAEAGAWHVYEDVRPTLEALARRGVKLGVISNWDDRLRPLLARLGLADYFSSVVISCEVGAAKPDSRLFHQAAAELAVTPGELVHVGDSYAMDVLGAEKMGAIARQVVRSGTALEPWQIRSLRDVEALLLRQDAAAK